MARTRSNGETQREYASRIIREKIISMELEPGQSISENELSQTLGISRTPVREALRELVNIQMIEVMPQRGCRVALIDYTMIEEARFTRQVLETSILPKVCNLMQSSDLLELRQILQGQELLLQSGPEENARFMALDNAFHAKLFEIAQMSMTHQMMLLMQIHFDRVRRIALHIGRNSEIVKEHNAILDAIEKRDVELAREQMMHHLSQASLDRTAVEDAFPHYILNRTDDKK
ncbi:MAG: GntR family transcriptional regulator [Clostridia bacterium]|nr:GntR family transcriptional regulator [Clostridia bacterium]